MQAVESEAFHLLENVPKFRGRQEQLEKALGNNTLAILDREFLTRLLGGGADSHLRLMDLEGERLYSMVDRGEAFSHAASAILGAPIATGDMSAVYSLLKSGERIQRPIIRFWDLVVFAHQIGALEESACDRIRQTLSKLGERTHPCFMRQSYAAGLPNFYARLVCASHPRIGASQPQENFDERLTLICTQGAAPPVIV